MSLAGLAGLPLARRIAAARGRMLWNRWFVHASTGRRLTSAATVAGSLAFVVVFLWTPQFGVLGVISRHGADATLEPTLRGAIGLGLLGYLLIVLYGSVLFSVGSLLLSRDLELLLVSPHPASEVVGAKTWLRVGGLFLSVSFLAAPVLVGLPIVTGQPPAVILGLVVLLTLPLLPVAVVSTVVIGAIRYIPPERGRLVIASMAVLLAVGLNTANLVFNPTAGSSSGPGLKAIGVRAAASPLASSQWLPAGWGARAISDGLYGHWGSAVAWALLLAGIGVAAMLASIALSGRIYVAGWSENATGRNDAADGGPVRTGVVSRALGRAGVDRAALAIFTKDWKTRRRDVVMLVRMLIPVAFLAFLTFRSARNVGVFGELPPGRSRRCWRWSRSRSSPWAWPTAWA